MKIDKVWFDNEHIYIKTDVGHIVGNPLTWFPRLLRATEKQRQAYVIGAWGDSIRWEEIDEDLSLEGFFRYKVDVSNFACFPKI